MITLKTTADLSKANIPCQTGGVSRAVRCDVHSLQGKKSARLGSCNIQGAGRGTGSLEPWLLADTGTDGARPMGCLGEAAIGNPPSQQQMKSGVPRLRLASSEAAAGGGDGRSHMGTPRMSASTHFLWKTSCEGSLHRAAPV